MCIFCKNTTIESTTTHVVNYDTCVIIIKNVPCFECEQCGEKYYTDEVADNLENLVNMTKQLMQELTVIDYHLTVTPEKTLKEHDRLKDGKIV